MATRKNLTPDERARIAAKIREIQDEVRALIERLQATQRGRPARG